jgi:hypothetical protein
MSSSDEEAELIFFDDLPLEEQLRRAPRIRELEMKAGGLTQDEANELLILLGAGDGKPTLIDQLLSEPVRSHLIVSAAKRKRKRRRA